MRRCCWILLLSLVLVVPARAQETRGNISGTVKDAQGVVPGATVTITSTRHGGFAAARHQRQRLLRSAAAAARQLPDRGRDDRLQERCCGRASSLAVGQQVSVPLTLELGQVTEEITVTADSPLLDTSAVSSGAELRQPHGRRAADVLEHADHADALRGRRESVHQPEPGVAGLRRRHDAGGGRGVRRRRQQHLLDRRRDQQRQRPAHRGVAQLRHDSGDARRVVELRRRRSATAPACRFDGDARRAPTSIRGTGNYQYWTNKINELNPSQRLTFTPTGQGALRERPFAQPGVDGRRPGRDPEAGQRPQQAVLLRQLLARRRLHSRQEPGVEHGAGERGAAARRLLGSAQAAEPGAVSDLRPAHGAARSGQPEPVHPRSVPEQHHPGEPDRQSALQPVPADGADAESEPDRERQRRRPTTTTAAENPTSRSAACTPARVDYNMSARIASSSGCPAIRSSSR